MRVLEITGEPVSFGGQEAFIMNCITRMEDVGIEIDILTPYFCENENYRRLLSGMGGKIYELHLPFKPGKSRRNLLPSVRAFLKGRSYDVVHIHSGSISALAYMAKAAGTEGIKKIIVHSHSTGIRNMKHTLVKAAFSYMLKVYPTHYCACSMAAGRMKFPLSIPDERIIILKNGIDTDRFAFDKLKREELRKKYEIADSTLVIGHVGRFTYEKNHEFIIRMFLKLLQKRNDSRLLLAGDGKLREKTEEAVKKYGIEDKVIFTGFTDKIWEYYSMMDVFILPSLYEGFPISVLEAQASGLPCVLSTGVTEDAVLCAGVDRIDTDNEDKWVVSILDKADIRGSGNAGIIQKNGYGIMDTAARLKEIYLS